MASRTVLDPQARAAVHGYLAQCHPELLGEELVGLKLGSAWLVEIQGNAGGTRVVMMVDTRGVVEEVGARTISRGAAARSFADLRAPAAGPRWAAIG